MNANPITQFVQELSRLAVGSSSFNPFAGRSENAYIRRKNLELYLTEMKRRQPKMLLVGEAPGYRGMRLTGVPFTNSVILLDPVGRFELFGAERGYRVPTERAGVAAEPTATVMWNALTELQTLPLLWSAYPLHPHRPGERLSNRLPSAAEVASGVRFWRQLRQIFEIETVVAVGGVAYRTITGAGEVVERVRHPSHGGKVEFTAGLRALITAA